MRSRIVRWGALVLMIGALAGCGSDGGSSSDSTAAAPAAGGSTTTTSVVAAAAVAANDTATNPTAAFSAVQNAGVAPVIVNSPPKVNFAVFSDGAVVKGLTASNVSVIMAKLVPGTKGAPDQWVSYTYRTEKATSTVGPGGKAVLASATQATTDAKQTDAALLAAQLAYNDAGYYTYTFSTDIKDPTKTNGVTFEPSLTHRVALQLSYKNKAGATVVVNPYFDFTVDASGNAVAVTDSAKTRKVVDISSCNECHSKLAMHGGGRVDTQYCVLCHNAGTTDANSGNVLDLRTMAHRIHAGEHVKELFGKDYTIWGYRDSKFDFSEVTYPQPLTNCVKCHDGSKKDAAGKQLAAQGDNWKNVPSRAACGTCHAGIDFTTGKGATIGNAEADLDAGKAPGTTATGHIGGSKQDDTQCVLCHGAADIPVYHVTVDPKLSAANSRAWYTPAGTTTAVAPAAAAQLNMPEGVYKIDFEIKQVTVTGAAGAKKAKVVYRIMKDGKPATLNATGTLMDNIDGTPSVYVTYGVPQDGIATPADWNANTNATVKALRDGKFQTGPDADGYYTATLPTSATAFIPDAATMVTGAMGINYGGLIQLKHAAYPNGILLREPKFAMKLADGYTARRSIVSAAKCNNCHGQLGILPTFHGGARNNGEGCATGGCHDANKNTGHTGASYSFGGGWSVQIKNMVHGIHGAKKREQAFTYEASAANPLGFDIVTYPGVLKNCEQCHVAGGYDFSGPANKAAVPNLLWTTDAKTDMTNAANVASIGLSPWVTTLGKGQIDYRPDHLVSSPIASSCFGCHDSSKAVTHMQGNGGTLVSLFSSVASVATRPAVGATSTMTFKKELCMDCHDSTSVYGLGIKAVHAK